VKVRALASHQQVKNMWIKSEKHLFQVHTSQPEEPALSSEFQLQYEESCVKDFTFKP
jgi:hypothetical protein